MHSFKNTGAVDAKFLAVVTPAGLENFFAEALQPAADRSTAPPPINAAMLARIPIIAAKHGLEITKPAH
jgi:hypothetical protein